LVGCQVKTPTTLSADRVPTGPEIYTGNRNFEIKTGLIIIIQASPFFGKPKEDKSAHLQ
jgi:hypothetical protein